MSDPKDVGAPSAEGEASSTTEQGMTTEPGMSRQSAARRAAVAGARAAGATVGVGIAVLAVVAAVFAPIPDPADVVPSVVVTPVATPQQLVCPGALLRLGNSEGQDASTATPIGAPAISTGASASNGSDTDIATATAFGDGGGLPVVIESPNGDDRAADAATVAGSQSQTVNEPDVSGFAAATCSSASSDTWLVGGSTATGRTTLVTLANPGDVASTVSLEFFSEEGAISAPGATGIVVEPNGQRVLSLAGFAPDTASPVVHVTSEGAAVVAHLQQSIVRGLEPAGVDIVGATTSPSRSVTVPGVIIRTPDNIESRLAQDDANGDLRTAVRLFVPGADDATATIIVTSEDGEAAGVSFDATLPGRAVTDVPIEGLPAGTYTVTVASSVPVVGAVRVSTASSPDAGTNTSDFAWLASPTPLAAQTTFTAGEGPGSTLHIANPGDAAADVTLAASGGEPDVRSLAPTSSLSVPLTAGTTYTFSSSAPVLAAVGFASDSQLAGVTVDPRLADAEPIVVYP